MKESGYSAKERFEAICGRVMRVEKTKKKRDNREIRSLHGQKNDIIDMKSKKGGQTASTWYLGGRTSKTGSANQNQREN